MSNAVVPVALAGATALATLAVAPPVMAVLARSGLMDVPNHRSSHLRPTLRGGGLAPLIGLLVVAAITPLLPPTPSMPWVALAGCALVAALGLIVDVAEPAPWIRLLGLAVLGGAIGAASGGIVTGLIGAVAMPVVVNVVNFMDGINGITALTVIAWGLVVIVGGGLLGGVSTATIVLASLAVGAAGGFLPWNTGRARMFLGDCGSYLFGALIVATLLVEQSSGAHPWLVLVPMTAYLLDTGVTLLRRARRGAPLTQAHREHLYQRLSRRPGWTHLRVAGLWGGAALGLGGVCVIVVQNGAL